MTETFRRGASLCWHCDRMVDALTNIENGAEPTPGSVALCLYCGAVAMVGPDMVLLPPTEAQLDDLDDLQADADFRRQYVRFAWARQRVMLKGSLMRPDQGPDR